MVEVNPSQVRRELDRRRNPSRQYTECTIEEHKEACKNLEGWTDESLLNFLIKYMSRTDIPSAVVDACSCGGGLPINRWG